MKIAPSTLVAEINGEAFEWRMVMATNETVLYEHGGYALSVTMDEALELERTGVSEAFCLERCKPWGPIEDWEIE